MSAQLGKATMSYKGLGLRGHHAAIRVQGAPSKGVRRIMKGSRYTGAIGFGACWALGVCGVAGVPRVSV